MGWARYKFDLGRKFVGSYSTLSALFIVQNIRVSATIWSQMLEICEAVVCIKVNCSLGMMERFQILIGWICSLSFFRGVWRQLPDCFYVTLVAGWILQEEFSSPNLQARFSQHYPADFVGYNQVIQVNPWFPKNGNQGSFYLYTMPWDVFPRWVVASKARALGDAGNASDPVWKNYGEDFWTKRNTNKSWKPGTQK